MIDGMIMKGLARQVLEMEGTGLKLSHPALVLARAVLSLDDPETFIRTMSKDETPVAPHGYSVRPHQGPKS